MPFLYLDPKIVTPPPPNQNQIFETLKKYFEIQNFQPKKIGQRCK